MGVVQMQLIECLFPITSYREDLRRWFIQQEVDLFRYRFNDLYPKQKLEFLHRNNLQYDTVSDEPIFYFNVDTVTQKVDS